MYHQYSLSNGDLLGSRALVEIFFKIFFFNVYHLKVFIEFVTILLLLYILVFWPRGLWDRSSPARNGTCIPASEGEALITRLPDKSPLLKFKNTLGGTCIWVTL